MARGMKASGGSGKAPVSYNKVLTPTRGVTGPAPGRMPSGSGKTGPYVKTLGGGKSQTGR